MKKFISLAAFLLSLLLFTACSIPEDLFQLVSPISYTVETEHESTSQNARLDDLTAQNYNELRKAIGQIISRHMTEGYIQVPAPYPGNISEDAKNAVYDVWKNNPLPAYAVEYISAECNQLLSYYEVTVIVNYRKSAKDMDEIVPVPSVFDARTEIRNALDSQSTNLTLQIANYRASMDWQNIVSSYCSDNPESIMEEPTLSMRVFPSEGYVRILEMEFSYSHSIDELKNMKSAVSSVLSSAAGYVRYRRENMAKAELLYSYLRDRFDYVSAPTDTPMYSFLCEGIADPKTVSQAFEILLKQVNIPCRLVNGYLEGEPYWWIILTIDDVNYHTDPYHDIMNGSYELLLHYDDEMSGFSWDTSLYPACPVPEQSPQITADTSDATGNDGESENTFPEEQNEESNPENTDDVPPDQKTENPEETEVH